MRPIAKFILFLILGWGLVYLIGSFMTASLNIANWAEPARVVVGLLGFIVALGAFFSQRDFWEQL